MPPPDTSVPAESPVAAICARGDLDPTHPKAYGCYDAKLTNYQLALKNGAEVGVHAHTRRQGWGGRKRHRGGGQLALSHVSEVGDLTAADGA